MNCCVFLQHKKRHQWLIGQKMGNQVCTQTQVTLLLKKLLNPAQVDNYKVISPPSFQSKILKSTVSNHIFQFLSENNLYNLNQFCLTQGHISETALLLVMESLHSARASGQSSSLLPLDLSAAFDMVTTKTSSPNSWSLVSQDLPSTGSCSNSGRSFRVSLEGGVHLTTWVPQGSVLCPHHFSLYTISLGAIILSYNSHTIALLMILRSPFHHFHQKSK